VPQWQLTFPDSLGRVKESLAYILRSEVGMLGDDLADRHPVCHHCHDRRNRHPQAAESPSAMVIDVNVHAEPIGAPA
jgi:hypothetical protein